MITVSNKAFILSAVGTCLGIGFIIKDRYGGKKYTYKTKDARRKVAIVTGASSGIGKAVARELAFRKATIVLACKDIYKCQEYCSSLKLFSRNPRIRCMQLDLASQDSIRDFVQDFNKEYSRLDILINNAGILMGKKRSFTKDGIEMHLGVNYMGHYLLTNLLLPKLKESAPSRIINVTCICYKKGEINIDDLNCIKKYDPQVAYNQSKLANMLFTKEMAKRLEGTGVTVNAVEPGVVNTNLLRHYSYHKSIFSGIFLKPFLWMVIKNCRMASQSVLFAAIDPSIKQTSGKLFNDMFEEEEIAPIADDDITAAWLWSTSAKWTKLDV